MEEVALTVSTLAIAIDKDAEVWVKVHKLYECLVFDYSSLWGTVRCWVVAQVLSLLLGV